MTNDELRKALEESVKLQSHYAELLNGYDGGSRMTFKSAEEWIARLIALGILSALEQQGEGADEELGTRLSEFPWIIYWAPSNRAGKPPHSAQCAPCGQMFVPDLPMESAQYTAQLTNFAREHMTCCDDPESWPVMDRDIRLIDWFSDYLGELLYAGGITSLQKLQDANVGVLCKIRGIGPTKAMECFRRLDSWRRGDPV